MTHGVSSVINSNLPMSTGFVVLPNSVPGIAIVEENKRESVPL